MAAPTHSISNSDTPPGARQRWIWLLATLLLLATAAHADRWLLQAVAEGRAILIDPQIYFCAALGHEQGLDPYRGGYPPGCFDGPFRFVYPPALLELFAWLRPPDLGTLHSVVLVLYVAAFAFLAWGLGRLLWPRLRWPTLLVLALLANPATLLSWSYYGNIAVLLYALLLAGCLGLLWWPSRGPLLLVGAVVMAACFKWILVLYLLPLLLAEGWRGLRWALGAVLLLALLYGLDSWRAPDAFAGYLAAFESHRDHVDLGMGIPTFGFDLIEAFAGARDLSDAAEWTGRAIWALFAAILLTLAGVACRRLDRRHRLLLGLLLAGLLLPRVKMYDWDLLLPVTVYFTTATLPARSTLVPSWLLFALRFAAIAALLLLPFQTAFYLMVFGTLAWLMAVACGWVLVRAPDIASLVPRALAPLLLRRG